MARRISKIMFEQMKRGIILYVLGVIIFFSSCGTYKKLAQLEPTNVAEFSSDVFSGNYQNKTITKDSTYHATGHNLWYSLCDVNSINGSKVKASDSAIVNLRFANNRLYAQLIEGGAVLQEIVLKAKVKDNYLSVKRKYFLIPILPMLYYYYNYKLILANIENENLILKMYYDHSAAMLIMAAGDSGTTSAEFVKIE